MMSSRLRLPSFDAITSDISGSDSRGMLRLRFRLRLRLPTWRTEANPSSPLLEARPIELAADERPKSERPESATPFASTTTSEFGVMIVSA